MVFQNWTTKKIQHKN